MQEIHAQITNKEKKLPVPAKNSVIKPMARLPSAASISIFYSAFARRVPDQTAFHESINRNHDQHNQHKRLENIHRNQGDTGCSNK